MLARLRRHCADQATRAQEDRVGGAAPGATEHNVSLTPAQSSDMPAATSPHESAGLGYRDLLGRALRSLPPARRRLQPPQIPCAADLSMAAATHRPSWRPTARQQRRLPPLASDRSPGSLAPPSRPAQGRGRSARCWPARPGRSDPGRSLGRTDCQPPPGRVPQSSESDRWVVPRTSTSGSTTA